MEVILLEKVYRLGDLGDRVKVRSGYGRNFLIPTRKAVPATAANLAKFEAERQLLLKANEERLAEAQKRAGQLTEMAVTISAKAGSEGRLFGSVGTQDIADAVTEAGVEVAKREVRMPEGPLREVGEHAIELHLHPDVNVTIKVIIVGTD
jgi:large subunit ribosomal protein L9